VRAFHDHTVSAGEVTAMTAIVASMFGGARGGGRRGCTSGHSRGGAGGGLRTNQYRSLCILSIKGDGSAGRAVVARVAGV
jgi:hypothetical protein